MIDTDLAPLVALARERSAGADAAHDFQHVSRVAASARVIAEREGADAGIAVAAAWLHELFNYPKSHPESHRSGEVCAEHARSALEGLGWPAERAARVSECIRTHAFSSGLQPATLEAAVLQDADRLDAIGAIGVARCFATAGVMRVPFYHPDDPTCDGRAPDDKSWALDHFYRKLLRLPQAMNTTTGRALAAERAAFMRSFIDQLLAEAGVVSS